MVLLLPGTGMEIVVLMFLQRIRRRRETRTISSTERRTTARVRALHDKQNMGQQRRQLGSALPQLETAPSGSSPLAVITAQRAQAGARCHGLESVRRVADYSLCLA